MSVLNLTTFMKLTKYLPNSDQPDVVLTDIDFSSASENFIGISSVNVSVENTSNMSEIKVEIKVGGKMSEGETINKMFTFENEWKLELGWSTPNQQIKNNKVTIKRMKLKTWQINYDIDIRGYSITLEFLPIPFLILSDIPLSLCKNSLKNIEKNSKNISIGYVIDQLLTECRQILENIDEYKSRFESIKETQENTQVSERFPFNEAQALSTSTPGRRFNDSIKFLEIDATGLRGAISKELISSLSTSSGIDLDYIILSDYLIRGRPDDVPRLNQVRLDILAKDDEDARKIYDAFRFEKMADTSTIDKLNSDLSYKLNFTVYTFLEELLDKNKYALSVIPNIFDLYGNPIMRIIQASMSETETSFVEREFVGIQRRPGEVTPSYNTIPSIYPDGYDPNKLGPIYNDEQPKIEPSVKLFGSREAFNTLNNKNIILSINAATDAGKTSFHQSYIEDQINDVSGPNRINSNITNVQMKANILDIEKSTSKNITMEIMGYPEISYGDNIFVAFFGDLFTGTYKTLSVNHNITTNSFTTSLECVRIKLGTDQVDSGLVEGGGANPKYTPSHATEDFFKKLLAGKINEAKPENPNILVHKYGIR